MRSRELRQRDAGNALGDQQVLQGALGEDGAAQLRQVGVAKREAPRPAAED